MLEEPTPQPKTKDPSQTPNAGHKTAFQVQRTHSLREHKAQIHWNQGVSVLQLRRVTRRHLAVLRPMSVRNTPYSESIPPGITGGLHKHQQQHKPRWV